MSAAIKKDILDYVKTHDHANYNTMVEAFIAPLVESIDDLKDDIEQATIDMEMAGEITVTPGCSMEVAS